jgi:hypothetical protein
MEALRSAPSRRAVTGIPATMFDLTGSARLLLGAALVTLGCARPPEVPTPASGALRCWTR